MGNAPYFLAVFLSSWMLLWASAAVIPILLHFLTRRYRQEIHWAAVQFLLAAHQKAAKRFRIWQWLLLALRTLALILFAVALADPIFNQLANQSQTTQQPQLNIIIIDASLSMQSSHGRSSRWDNAIAHGLDLCTKAQEGDGFLLAKLTTQFEEITKEISFDAESTASALRALRPSDTVADPRLCIDKLNEFLSELESGEKWNSKISVSIITDLQTSNWSFLPSDGGLLGSPKVSVVDVGRSITTNSLVESLEISDRLVLDNKPVTIRSTVRHQTLDPDRSVLLQLLIDDVVQESKRINATSEIQPIDWHTKFAAGTHNVSVRCAVDSQNADNEHFAVVRAREILRIACVGTGYNATKFVATALRSGTDGAFAVTEIHAPLTKALQLGTYDLVVVCDAVDIQGSVVSAIKSYLKAGGSLLMWLGPDLDPKSANAAMKEFGVCEITSESEPGKFHIDPRDYMHPIVEPFRLHPRSGLLTAPIFRYWELDTSNSIHVEQVLDIGNSPLLLAKQVDTGGHVAVFATSATLSAKNDRADPWNALVLWPCFTPLVQETATYLIAASDSQHASFTAGDRFEFTLGPSETETMFSLVAQNGASLRLQRSVGQSTLFGPELMETGIYKLFGADDRELAQFAVNFPIEECSTDRLDASQLPAYLQTKNSKSEAVLSSTVKQNTTKGRALFQFILAAVIGCMVLECLVSRIMRTKFA